MLANEVICCQITILFLNNSCSFLLPSFANKLMVPGFMFSQNKKCIFSCKTKNILVWLVSDMHHDSSSTKSL